MSDDWRVRVDLQEDGFARRFSRALQASELEHDLQSSFHDRVVVSVDGAQVFLYSDRRDQAQAAERLARQIGARHGWTLDTELRRWHPAAEVWEDPEKPLPADAQSASDEAASRAAVERRGSAEQGYPEFEVRIEVDGRGAARELSERLRSEGLPNVHRWRYVLVGAADEADLEALAQRLRGELPEATITTETNPRAIWDSLPGNPFAVLGGLAG